MINKLSSAARPPAPRVVSPKRIDAKGLAELLEMSSRLLEVEKILNVSRRMIARCRIAEFEKRAFGRRAPLEEMCGIAVLAERIKANGFRPGDRSKARELRVLCRLLKERTDKYRGRVDFIDGRRVGDLGRDPKMMKLIERVFDLVFEESDGGLRRLFPLYPEPKRGSA